MLLRKPRLSPQKDAVAKIVKIYTDGACRGNPGPGGYAAVLLYKKARKELSGGFRWTTNNRMEIIALIAAVSALKEPCETVIYSDSQYLVKCLTKGWIATWKRKGWKTTDGSPVLNRDLWEQLDDLLSHHSTNLKWVKGHAGNKENNRCDQLAVTAAKNHGNRVDTGYEVVHPMPARGRK